MSIRQIFCSHKWDVLVKERVPPIMPAGMWTEIKMTAEGIEPLKLPKSLLVILKCDKCGAIQKHTR